MQLRIFWSSIKLEPISDYAKDAGTTWIELFALFCILGGHISPTQDEGPNHIKPRFNVLFKCFKSASKALLVFASRETSYLVKTLASRAMPLRRYGITSFMPMITSRVAVSFDIALALHAAMCSIHGRVLGVNKLPQRLRVGLFHIPKFTPWEQN